jgi:hypothetical protein
MAVAKDLTRLAQSSRLAKSGGRGMSFNICRGTLGIRGAGRMLAPRQFVVSSSQREASELLRD